MGYGLWACGAGAGVRRAAAAGRGSSPSRPCCGGLLGSATRRQRARHRGPLTGRPARQPLALAWGPRPNSVCLALNGVIPKSPRRDSSPGVTSSRGGGGVAGAHHGRVGAHRGLGCGTWPAPRDCSSSVNGAGADPKPREGRGSAERPSVAGAPTGRGMPTFAATARPRRGSHVPTGAAAHTEPAESTKGPEHTARGPTHHDPAEKRLTRPPRPCTRQPTAVPRHRRPRRAP